MTTLTIETTADIAHLHSLPRGELSAIRLARPDLVHLQGPLNAAYFACGCATARVLAMLTFLVSGGVALAVLLAMDAEGLRLWGGAGLAGLAGFVTGGFAGEQLGLKAARRQFHQLLGELDIELRRLEPIRPQPA